MTPRASSPTISGTHTPDLRRFTLHHDVPTVRLEDAVDVVTDEQGLARLHHIGSQAADGLRLVGEPLTTLDGVGITDEPGATVDDADVDDLRVEDLLDLVADEVVHRLHVQLRSQPLLDAVDDGQLGRPLIGLGQQALCLVEQARVLERDAQAGGQRRQQAHVRFGERVRPIQVLERDAAAYLAGGEQRCRHQAECRLALDRLQVLPGFEVPGRDVGDVDRLRAR